MTAGSYLLSTVELLLFIGALGFAAYQARVWLVPTWSGAIARLTEVVITVSLAIWVGEALGIVGLFKEVPLLVCSVAIAAVAWRAAWIRAPSTTTESFHLPPIGWLAIAAGAGVAALVFAKWALGTLPILDEGMWVYDVMLYHMPTAAGFAQSGSVTGLHFTDPTAVSWILPVNSELIHGEGIAIVGSDIYSPLMNLGWMSLALLAAWCIGRPYGRAWLSLLAVGMLLLAPAFIQLQPGEALSDTPATAFLLCSAAILVAAGDLHERRGQLLGPWSVRPLLLAALAAGLALGTKGTLIAIVAIMGICAMVISAQGFRVRTALVWTVGALSTGGFWYVRNLIAIGNPIPWVGIGPISLPAPHQIVVLHPGWQDFSLADYLTNGVVWRQYLEHGFKLAFGELWPLLLVLALLGCIGALLPRNTPVQQALGGTALLGIIVFVLQPGTASGPPGQPQLFFDSLRYVLPALALALALLPTLRLARSSWVTLALTVLLGVLFVLKLRQDTPLSDPYLGGALVMTAGALLVVGLTAGLSDGILRRLDGALFGLALLGVATLLYWPQVEQYMAKRYENIWPQTGLSASFRWAKGINDARIALAGNLSAHYQYGYYGDDSSNRVMYVGERGPHGSFNPIQTCTAWRAAINAGHFDYIVTTPNIIGSSVSPEEAWAAPGSATTRILKDGPVSVFRVDGPLDPADCPA